jgi:hypothetical protein
MTRLLGILTLTAVLAAGACGGSPAAGSTTSTTVDRDKAMLDFARCMRQHGVNMPDPTTDANGGVNVRIQGDAGDKTKVDAAQKACAKYMAAGGPKNLDPAQRQALDDAMVAFARCMRAKGIDVPDPSPGGGIQISAKAGQRPPEDDPAFTAAETDCRAKHLTQVEKDLGLDGPKHTTSGGPARGTSSGGKG